MKFDKSILIVVDAQCGFSELCPEELPVPKALDIVPIINNLLDKNWAHKFASLDWHLPSHCSFKEKGGLYNPHCVQNTQGSQFLPGLNTEKFTAIFRKAYSKEDSFSFIKEHRYVTNSMVFKDVFLCGICTNICVFETAKDIVKNCSFVNSVNIIEDASASLDLRLSDYYNINRVKDAMDHLGIKFIQSKDLKEE